MSKEVRVQSTMKNMVKGSFLARVQLQRTTFMDSKLLSFLKIFSTFFECTELKPEEYEASLNV